jgi:hypothetical protein
VWLLTECYRALEVAISAGASSSSRDAPPFTRPRRTEAQQARSNVILSLSNFFDGMRRKRPLTCPAIGEPSATP